MITLLVHLANQRDRGVQLDEFQLGNADYHHGRTINFLEKHGFLDIAFNLFGKVTANFVNDRPPHTAITLVDFKRLFDARSYPLAYKDSIALPMQLFRTDNYSDDDAVAALINALTNSLFERLYSVNTSMSVQQNTKTKIHLVMYELVSNVVRHAYTTNAPGHFAVYARYRIEPSQSPLKNTKSMSNFFGLEGFVLNTEHDSWLELYVVDCGAGLLSAVSQWKSDELEVQKKIEQYVRDINVGKNPIGRVLEHLFSRNISRFGGEKQRRTKMLPALTGMAQIGRAMKPGIGGDYIRIHVGGSFSGRPFPWESVSQRNIGRQVPGTQVVAYLRGGFSSELAAPSLLRITDSIVLSGLRRVYNRSIRTHERLPLIKMSGVADVVASHAAAKSATCLIRLPENIAKNHFYALIQNLSMNIKVHRKEYNTIIFVDIATEIAGLLIGVLPRLGQYLIRMRVVFVTTNGEVAVFQRPPRTAKNRDASDRFDGESEPSGASIQLGHAMAVRFIDPSWSQRPETLPLTTNQQQLQKIPAIVDNSCSLAATLATLREHDTDEFWRIHQTNTNAIDNPLIMEPVVWQGETDREIILRGYIDVPLALANRQARQIVERALARALALYNTAEVFYLDTLIKGLQPQQSSLQKPKKGRIVFVGSVLVTGSTIERMLSGGAADAEVMHLMHHPSSRDTLYFERSLPLIDWRLPDHLVRVPPAGTPGFRRIRGSFQIARGGEASVTLPRFDDPDFTAGVYRHSYYGQTPSAAYKYLDENRLIKLGHWVNDKHHDLFGINIRGAVLLREYGKEHSNSVLKWCRDIVRNLVNASQKSWIICYISHDSTDLLIRSIFDTADTDCPPLLPTIPLCQVPGFPSEVLRIPHSTLERLKNATASSPDAYGILLLDDGSVTGSTVRYVSELLVDALGVEVRSLCLIDRAGEPVTRGRMRLAFSKSHYRLWRFDLPTLGSPRSCILCQVMHSLRGRVRFETSRTLRARVNHWLETWAARRMEDGWETGPRLLDLTHARSMALSRDEQGPHAVQESVLHVNGTTLAAHLCEITRATPRRDKVLEEARRISNGLVEFKNIEVAICLVATNTLLYFDSIDDQGLLERFSLLFELVTAVSRSSEYTALAGLVFELVDRNLAYLLIARRGGDVFAGMSASTANIDAFLMSLRLLEFLAPEQLSLVEGGAEATPTGAGKSRIRSMLNGMRYYSGTFGDVLRATFELIGFNAHRGHVSYLQTLLSEIIRVRIDPTASSTNRPWLAVALIERLLHCLHEISDKYVEAPLIAQTETVRLAGAERASLARLPAGVAEIEKKLAQITGELSATNSDYERYGVLSAAGVEHLALIYEHLFASHTNPLQRYVQSAFSIEVEGLYYALTSEDGFVAHLQERWSGILSSRGLPDRSMPRLGVARLSGAEETTIFYDGRVESAIIDILGNTAYCIGRDLVLEEVLNALDIPSSRVISASHESAERWALLQFSDGYCNIMFINGFYGVFNPANLSRYVMDLDDLGAAVHSNCLDYGGALYCSKLVIPACSVAVQ